MGSYHFFLLLVYGKESASFLMGKSMKSTFTDLGKGRVAAHWTSTDPAMAKFNFFGIFYEGNGHTINMPALGGMVKYNSQSTPDGYKTTMDCEKFGNFDVVEVYSSQGLAKVRNHLAKYIHLFVLFFHDFSITECYLQRNNPH